MYEVTRALTAAGLIRREPDPDHGRVQRAKLTDAGLALLAACDAVVDEMERDMLGSLGGTQKCRLDVMLQECIDGLG